MSNTKIEVVNIPKKLKDITDLYRACRFEEADKLLNSFEQLPHQTAAVRAQLSFFHWNFIDTIKYIMEYFLYLGEWYSGNFRDITIFMLKFALMMSDKQTKKDTLDKLTEMRDKLSIDFQVDRNYKQFLLLEEIADSAYGRLDTNSWCCYYPPEKPKSLDEIIKGYSIYHKKEIDNAGGNILNDERIVSDLLILIKSSGRCEDFIKLYEKFPKSKLITLHTAVDAAKIYAYCNKFDKARQVIIDSVKYRWQPIEWTDIMPISALLPIEYHYLYTKEFFDKIYNLPKGISENNKCEKLKLSYNYDQLFSMTEFEDFEILTVKIGAVSIVSGKITVSDPLVYLDNNLLPYGEKLPKGEYDVTALIAKRNGDIFITAVKVEFTKEPAASFYLATNGTETRAEIYEIEDNDIFGFPVDSGLAAIMDDKVKKEFLKFCDKWYKVNNNCNIYEVLFKPLFEKSYIDFPDNQRTCGDFIDFVIPGSEYHIPIFTTGFGDGYYHTYFGYDEKGKLCSMVVEFITFD